MKSLNDHALAAIGLHGDGDDDPTLSAIDSLLVDVEVLRYALYNADGEEEAMVGFAESAVERFLNRLRAIRALHDPEQRLGDTADPFRVLQEMSRLNGILCDSKNVDLGPEIIDGIDSLLGDAFAAIGATPKDGQWLPPQPKPEVPSEH